MEVTKYYGGVEGGASNTKAIILDAKGNILAQSNAGGSNPWVLGIEATGKLLLEVLQEAKTVAQIGLNTPLETLGLSMSGMAQKDNQLQVEEYLSKHDPNLANHFHFYDDSVGSIYTASDEGGMVIISGTGSMAKSINSSGVSQRCGGWGHMIGDEGGAYYIASKLIRKTFRARDGNKGRHPEKPIPDYKVAEKLICEHFQIDAIDGILRYMHNEFKKSNIASLTEKIAQAAREGDPLCQEVLCMAGEQLGAMARTLAPNLADTASEGRDGIFHLHDVSILCIGSVWKSLDLLWDSFMKSATSVCSTGNETREYRIDSFKLHTTTETSAIGAAWKAASEHSYKIPLNKASFVEIIRSFPSE